MSLICLLQPVDVCF